MNQATLKMLYRVGKMSRLLSEKPSFQLSFLPKQEILWYRNPKCGQSTIDYALRSFDTKYYRASIDIPVLSQFANWKSFGFVRHPETRFLSLWKNKVYNISAENNLYGFSAEEREYLLDLDNFINWVASFDLDSAECHLRKQVRLVPPENVDFIGRIEQFDTDWNRLKKTLGLSINPVEVKNANPLDVALTPAQKHKIRDLYKEDLKTFYSA
jgi:hypothetical protein